MNEIDTNQQVADRICRDLAYGGRKFAVGDYVALLDGEVVVVAQRLDEALQQLRSIDPDPNRGMLLKVAPPVVDVVR